MEAYLAEFPIGRHPSKPHRHGGAELIYVLKGQLVVGFDDEEVELGEGDAMYFDSSYTHTYAQKGRSTATAIVAVTSP